MQLGPVQERWVQFLEQNPDLQGTNQLGYIVRDGENLCDGTKMCCLGAALFTLFPHKVGSLDDYGYKLSLEISYELLGLRDPRGSLFPRFTPKFTNEGIHLYSLAEMNDNGFTWPEIAAYIRRNPENVFERSV